MKILFCFYPLFVKYNHGIALLSQLCKDRGIETELYLLDDANRFISHLSQNDYDYVSFSVVSSLDYTKSLPFFEVVNSLNIPTLLGGPWTQLCRPVSDHIDLICRGEGENLPDFLLNCNDSMFKVNHIIKDLNSLPLPDYDIFKDTPFDRGIPNLNGKRCLPYYSSRGCPNFCSFCQVRYQPPYRTRTKVCEDLTILRDRYAPDVFMIGDAQLPYHSKAWRDSWYDLRVPFVSYIRADIKPLALKWLIDRGMIGCAFGIESGDEKYRNDVLRKNLMDEQIWRTIDILDKNQIWYIPFFMVGTPNETFVIRKKTADMMKKIGGYSILWKYEEL